MNFYQGLDLVVHLLHVETRFHDHILVLVFSGWVQVLNLVHKSEAALAYLAADLVLVLEDCPLDRANLADFSTLNAISIFHTSCLYVCFKIFTNVNKIIIFWAMEKLKTLKPGFYSQNFGLIHCKEMHYFDQTRNIILYK